MKVNNIKAYAGKGNLSIDYFHEEFDYYKNDEEKIRVYGGNKLKEQQGIEKHLTFSEIKRLIQNKNVKPKLDKNGNEEKLHKNLKLNANTCFEYQLDVPKTVSLYYTKTDDEKRKKLDDLLAQAEREFFKQEIEPLLQYKLTKNNKQSVEMVKADEVMTFSIQHLTNREKEPLLHRHNFIIGQYIDENGKSRTVDMIEVKNNIKLLQIKWQAHLAKKFVNELGLDVVGVEKNQTKNGNQNYGFELALKDKSIEVINKLVDSHSTRAKQIENYHNAQLAKNSDYDKFDKDNIEKAKVSTRKKKEITENESLEVLNNIRSKLSFTVNKATALVKEYKQEPINKYSKTLLKDFGETNLTISKEDYIATMLGKSNYKLEVSQIEKSFDDLIKSKDIIALKTSPKKTVYFNKEAIKKEIELTGNITNYFNRNSSISVNDSVLNKVIKNFEKEKGFELIEEQIRYLITATSSKNGAVIRGVPGAGKTTCALALKQVFEASDPQVRVVGLAPTGKAAKGLSSEVGIETATIHSFNLQTKGKKCYLGKTEITDKTVILVDEAGMIGSKEYTDFLKKLEQYKVNPKIVLIGDHKQLAPVEKGQVFKSLVLEKQCAYSELKNINRQKNEENKKAIYQLEEGNHLQAYQTFNKLGMLEIVKTRDDWYKLAAKNYLESKQDVFQKIVLDFKREDVKAINNIIRGELRKGNTFTTKDFKVSLLDNEEKIVLDLAQGEKIKFCKNDKDHNIQNGTQAIITSIKQTGKTFQIECKDENNNTIKFNTKDYSNIVYGYALTIHSSQGLSINESINRISNLHNAELALVSNSRNKYCPIADNKGVTSNSKVVICEDDFKFTEKEALELEKMAVKAKSVNTREAWAVYDELKLQMRLEKVANKTSKVSNYDLKNIYDLAKSDMANDLQAKVKEVKELVLEELITNKDKAIELYNSALDYVGLSKKEVLKKEEGTVINGVLQQKDCIDEYLLEKTNKELMIQQQVSSTNKAIDENIELFKKIDEAFTTSKDSKSRTREIVKNTALKSEIDKDRKLDLYDKVMSDDKYSNVKALIIENRSKHLDQVKAKELEIIEKMNAVKEVEKQKEITKAKGKGFSI